ncbi:hypothetical protein K438DRAFT_1958070 [Mycena galopus ATCC 62051]|nr:hypothetical protein K438DRAFT_1958070 [Mycena galopus ATCC 62051]
MAPISLSFSVYSESTPAASTFGFAPSPTFSIGQAAYAGAAAHAPVHASPAPSLFAQASQNNIPDTGFHRFLVYMAIVGAVCFGCMAYVLAKPYLSEWCACGGQADDDDEKEKSFPGLASATSSRPPTIALPPRSATYGCVDIWIPQERPVYISQNDILRSGRGFFG